jgi:hypothetical protein
VTVKLAAFARGGNPSGHQVVPVEARSKLSLFRVVPCLKAWQSRAAEPVGAILGRKEEAGTGTLGQSGLPGGG